MDFSELSEKYGPELEPFLKDIKDIDSFLLGFQFGRMIQRNNLQQGRRKKRLETGKCEGAKNYWESEVGKATILRLVELRDSTESTWEEIAIQLNSEGFLTKSGKPWTLVNAQQSYRNFKLRFPTK